MNRDEIRQKCSSSKYASIDGVGFSILNQTFEMAAIWYYAERASITPPKGSTRNLELIINEVVGPEYLSLALSSVLRRLKPKPDNFPYHRPIIISFQRIIGIHFAADGFVFVQIMRWATQNVFSARVTFWPFKVVQGWFWYSWIESKARIPNICNFIAVVLPPRAVSEILQLCAHDTAPIPP